MSATSIQATSSLTQTNATPLNLNLINKFNAFADSQQRWSMIYWIGSLMLIGSFFLPVTFLFVYSLNGPVITFLALSMVSFFATLIANMGGMGIRVCLYSFFSSIILHLAMMLFTLISFYL